MKTKSVAELTEELAQTKKALLESTTKLTELQEQGFAIKPITFKHVKGVSERGAFDGIQVNGPFRGKYVPINVAKAILIDPKGFQAAVAMAPESVNVAKRSGNRR